jgi:hypothetical protein
LNSFWNTPLTAFCGPTEHEFELLDLFLLICFTIELDFLKPSILQSCNVQCQTAIL